MNEVIVRAVQAFEGVVRLIEDDARRRCGDGATTAIDPRLVDQLRRWVDAIARASRTLDERELAPLRVGLPTEDDLVAVNLLWDLAGALDARHAPAPWSTWRAVASWVLDFCTCTNGAEPFTSDLARNPELIGLVVSEAVSWEALSGVLAWVQLSHIVHAATRLRSDLPAALTHLASSSPPWLATRARVALEVLAGGPPRLFTTFGLEA